MRINLANSIAAAVLLLASGAMSYAETVTVSSEQLARMEQRLAQLEARLAEQEQETKEVKVLASTAATTGGNNSALLGNRATFDILAGSAWRNLRWTQEDQWQGIKRGISEEKVIEILGYPPRSVDSLKPRIDKVYWYETSLRDRSSGLRGKISFKKGKVVSFQKPNFDVVPAAQQMDQEFKQRRLP